MSCSSSSEKSPSAAESGATYQDPNTITRTPHPSTGEVYTDVSLDKKTKKKKTTEQVDSGPTYQVLYTFKALTCLTLGTIYMLGIVHPSKDVQISIARNLFVR